MKKVQSKKVMGPVNHNSNNFLPQGGAQIKALGGPGKITVDKPNKGGGRNDLSKQVHRAPDNTSSTDGPMRKIIKPVKGNKVGVNKDTGVIDPNKAVPEVTYQGMEDWTRNVNQANPENQTDAFGNTTNTNFDQATGQTTVHQEAGAIGKGIQSAFKQGLQGYNADIQSNANNARDANYSYQTRNLGAQKTQEMQDTKQELADRGIPYDPGDTKGLYGRTLQGVEQKYQGLYDQANNQAITQGNETLGAQVGAQNSIIGTLGGAAGAFAQNVNPYQSVQSNQAGLTSQTIGQVSGAAQGKYGIDKNYAAQMGQIGAQKEIAAANRAAAAANAAKQEQGGSKVVFNQ